MKPEPGERIVVDRPRYEAVLDSRGGSLVSWTLKDYQDEYGDPVILVQEELPGGVAQTPFLELDRGDLSREEWRAIAYAELLAA